MEFEWTFSCEVVTPEIAGKMLANNAGNRNIRPTVVAKYSATMISGNWMLSPEGICISPEGRLLNGQHRLKAVIRAGIPVQFLIIRNVDESVFKVLDRGAVRSIADAIGIPRKLVEVARIAATLSSHHPTSNTTVEDSVVEKLAIVLRDDHDDLMASCHTTAKVFSSAPFRLAACVRMLAGFDREYVRNTYRSLVLGHISDLPPIAQAAVGSVMAGRWDRKSGSSRQREDLARAWDLFDPAKSQNQRISLKSDERAIAEVTAILRACLAEDGK